MAAELGPKGIRVNAVAPGYTMTPAMKARIDNGERDPKLVIEKSALRRFVEPREVGEAILFLCSDAASAITGVTLAHRRGLARVVAPIPPTRRSRDRPYSGVVHVDRLLLEIGVEPVLAVFAADAAVAHAGMMGMDGVAARPVDVDLAELQFPDEPHHPPHVLGEDIGRKPIAALIGKPQPFVEIGHRHDRHDRAEHLVLHDLHRVVGRPS